MSRFAAGNVFLLLSMACAATAQIFLKQALDGVAPGLTWRSWQPLLAPDRAVRGGFALLLIVAGFVLWTLCLARLDLSYAYPIASGSILLVALLSVALLGESMSPRMWLGALLIVAGVLLLTPRGA